MSLDDKSLLYTKEGLPKLNEVFVREQVPLFMNAVDSDDYSPVNDSPNGQLFQFLNQYANEYSNVGEIRLIMEKISLDFALKLGLRLTNRVERALAPLGPYVAGSYKMYDTLSHFSSLRRLPLTNGGLPIVSDRELEEFIERITSQIRIFIKERDPLLNELAVRSYKSIRPYLSKMPFETEEQIERTFSTAFKLGSSFTYQILERQGEIYKLEDFNTL